jgi:hypothetical protein
MVATRLTQSPNGYAAKLFEYITIDLMESDVNMVIKGLSLTYSSISFFTAEYCNTFDGNTNTANLEISDVEITGVAHSAFWPLILMNDITSKTLIFTVKNSVFQ